MVSTKPLIKDCLVVINYELKALSLAKLAKRIKISKSTLSKFIQGKDISVHCFYLIVRHVQQIANKEIGPEKKKVKLKIQTDGDLHIRFIRGLKRNF